MIAEAVAPGFDFHDFGFIQPDELDALPEPTQKLLRPFQPDTAMDLAAKNDDFDRHYD